MHADTGVALHGAAQIVIFAYAAWFVSAWCRPQGCYGCRAPVVTTHTIRENTIALTGIEEEDLLFFSYSNVALAHLPYMVALDRCGLLHAGCQVCVPSRFWHHPAGLLVRRQLHAVQASNLAILEPPWAFQLSISDTAKVFPAEVQRKLCITCRDFDSFEAAN